MIITIQIPHILHLERKLFDSRGCLLLVRRDDFGSSEFTIYEMYLDDHQSKGLLSLLRDRYLAPSDIEILVEDQPHAADALPTTLSLGYIIDSDPEDESEDGPTDYPADIGDDDDDSLGMMLTTRTRRRPLRRMRRRST
ncbi:hypothetical protein Tco_1528373 [Tanacetum coccineum]